MLWHYSLHQMNFFKDFDPNKPAAQVARQTLPNATPPEEKSTQSAKSL
jgi:hypothetical protein